jgi:hypothetical protein
MRFLILASVAVILAGFGCRDNGLEYINSTKPIKRDFVWTIDSVYYGNLPGKIELEQIWGTSSTNLWGVAGDASDVRDCLWHYDGVRWSRATAGTPITDYTGNKVVYAIWGSADNDIWAFGRKINYSVLSVFIMHYDGVSWTDATPSNVSSLKSTLYTVYGISNDNIWVGGYEYALHYDGVNWTSYKISDSLIVGSITGNSDYMYLSAYHPYGSYSKLIYMYLDSTFIKLDSTTYASYKFGNIIWVTDGRLHSLTHGVTITSIKPDGNIDTSGWNRIFTTDAFLGEKYIQSSNNIFAVGQHNLVYHYNGSDWKQIIISIPNHTVDPAAWLWGVWADGNEVFICDWENGIVYHGR